MRCGLDIYGVAKLTTNKNLDYFLCLERNHSQPFLFSRLFSPLTFCNLHKFVCNICHCTLVEKHVLCNNNRHNLNFVTCIYDLKNLQNLHFQFVNNLLNSMQELKSSIERVHPCYSYLQSYIYMDREVQHGPLYIKHISSVRNQPKLIPFN